MGLCTYNSIPIDIDMHINRPAVFDTVVAS